MRLCVLERQTLRRSHDAVLSRISASLWLMMLQAQRSRRSCWVLSRIGTDPWHLGWDALWRRPSLYWCVRLRRTRSPWGELVYIGETECFERRFSEHVSRILNPSGETQHPFYQLIRRGSSDVSVIRSLLRDWLIFPFEAASVDIGARAAVERQWIDDVGTLNPPRIFRVLELFGLSRVRTSHSVGSIG